MQRIRPTIRHVHLKVYASEEPERVLVTDAAKMFYWSTCLPEYLFSVFAEGDVVQEAKE